MTFVSITFMEILSHLKGLPNLNENCPPTPIRNVSQATKDTYDQWIKANGKTCIYILVSLSKVLCKKHDVMETMKEIMESLQEMFEQPFYQLHHDALKYIYNCHMKEGTSFWEHVLDMMVQFYVAEAYGVVIDELS
ncbi:uncharacterized protein LOC120081069 [Benincasa hispida]|uniref:uncharacterized protein LOC120081069 n=1 Tax=Benincasa hispida TaxID=102211 RepID=UPI0019011F4A|nr:uncharacterized protein LOC120081069 [Benincasa hispida]